MGTRIEMTLTDDTTKIYEEADIVSATLIESNDPLCRELQVNTLELVLHSSAGDFDFFSDNGVLSKFAINQKVILKYIFDDNVTKQIGIFYIDDWKCEKDDQLRLMCSDAIGLLDKHIFREEFSTYEGYVLRPIGTLLKLVGAIEDAGVVYRYAYPRNSIYVRKWGSS